MQSIALQYRPKHRYLLTASQCQLPYTVTIVNKSQTKRIILSDKYRLPLHFGSSIVEVSWNVISRAETRFRLSVKRTSPFKSAGRQFSRLLAAELCASAAVMLDTPCSDVVWRVLATHSIRQFPFHFPYRASPRAITFQPETINVVHSTDGPTAGRTSDKRLQ